jgi:hypothetical protein
MRRAKILTTQATHTLEQLHAELGGKILDNKAEAKRLAEAMVHVEAVLKLLEPGYDVRPIAVRRRRSLTRGFGAAPCSAAPLRFYGTPRGR